ncbi:hypothetical protein [Streptomyces scopuliridis]|uniref:Uncharacterized protein n=1 Tax=Streptomyces scopuliridis TaxID=452529 RepID=A0ACD4ZRZ6_9ACTN|nr:hypothetical protein [Streptomyces scopuliridis]WSC01260.1 hypothetical protein OG835_32520 [Streptomyces scopuliridis]
MTTYTATCDRGPSDTIAASRDGDNIWLIARQRGDFKLDVYLAPEKAIEFARGLLHLAGDPVTAEARTVRVGDRVEITKYREWGASTFEGRTGRLLEIDSDSIPYRVQFDDSDDGEWATEVRRIPDVTATSPDSAGSKRESFVTHAKRLLDGTTHDGADVVRMAAFLAGE